MMIRRSKEDRKLTSLLALYEDYVLSCLNLTLAKTTALNYRSRCRHFFNSLPQPPSVADLTRANLRRFLLSEAEQKPSACDMNRAALNHFLRWLKEEGWIAGALPTANIALPPVKHKTRRTAVPDDAALRMIAACDRLPEKPFYRVRDKAVLCVLVYAGLRRQELLDLTPDCLDFRSSLIHVRHGKGDKERFVPMCHELCVALKDWLTMRPAVAHKGALFCRENSTLLAFHGLSALLTRAACVAGVPRFTPHNFRHGFATRILHHGTPPTVAQAMLGHEKFSTTEIYIHEVETAQLAQFAHLASLRPMEERGKESKKEGRRKLVRKSLKRG